MIKANKFQTLTFIILSLFFIGSLIYYYPLLPDKVASHFSLSGEVNGWMNKESFLIIMLVVFLIVSGTIFLGMYIIPKAPKSMISLPNKEFHLSDKQKGKTIVIINNFILLINNLTITLLIISNFFVFNINLGKIKKLPVFFDYMVIVYIISLFVIILRIYLKFKKIPANTL